MSKNVKYSLAGYSLPAEKIAMRYEQILEDGDDRFCDGEFHRHLKKYQGNDIFRPVYLRTANNLMELLMLIDAAEGFRTELIAVIPYFG